ncbi:hypothetical protein Vadar_015974 [Vaccinium darrowii]|uniref:Uncharacterized protein n=1 Tax=Vaccinium darrowii TaxID=229202 RepID=A0ACB7Y6X0_9ERIC|nr:hypothetical protein Vadar_015974 [Vaccinium darrowii]
MASFGSQGTPSRSSPRAKGKDKAGNQARARQRLQLEERASWTPALTETFLQCCADDIDNFGRVSTSLDKAAWLRVVADFNKRTNSNLQITQLKNRWDQLKREWAAWRMLNDDRSVTGIGWNPAKKTVTGPDHWWATMILRNKLAAKFKDAGLEHADLMERVFRNVTATGAGAYVPRSRQERMAEVESDNSHDLHSDGTNPVHSPEQFGPVVAKRLKSDSVAGGSGTQSYKSRVAASTAAMSESINELIQTVKTTEHRVVTHDAGRDLHIEAIKKLSSLPIFKDENNHECQELHWWAIRLFEKAGKVDAFLGFNSDVGRQTWLYYEHRAALNAYERGHSRDEAIPPPYFPPPPYDLL